MSDTITMKRSTLVSLIMIFLGLIIITAVTSLYLSPVAVGDQNNVYFCRDNDLVIRCDEIINGTICRYYLYDLNDTVGKTCSSGWEKLIDLGGENG